MSRCYRERCEKASNAVQTNGAGRTQTFSAQRQKVVKRFLSDGLTQTKQRLIAALENICEIIFSLKRCWNGEQKRRR